MARELLRFVPIALVIGCFPQFGEYGSGGASASAGGTGGRGGGEGGASPVCGAERFCVRVPTGWDGPVALTLDGQACNGDYEDEIDAGLTDFAADDAVCGCACGAAAGAACAVSVQRYFDDACANIFGLPISLAPATCVSVASVAAGSWLVTSAATPGSCPPEDQTGIPAPTSVSRRLCATEAPPDCMDGARCAARPGSGLEPRICVYDEGDVECPLPDFPQKVVLFTGGLDDQRGCDAPCSCTAPTATCGGSVSGHQGSACGIAQDAAAVGICDSDYLDSNQSLRYTPVGLDEGSCSALPRNPVGDVQGVSPVTVCCTGTLD